MSNGDRTGVKPKVMLIEACDFRGFPVGGQLTTAQQFVTVFGESLALVGVSIDDTPVGRWTRKAFNGVELDFFSFGRVDPDNKKPLIPRRLDAYWRLRFYKGEILSLGVGAAYVVAPEVMLAIQHWGLRIAYKFSGVENPLTMPRYAIGKWIAEPFERRLFSALAQHSELITAAADQEAIQALKARSGGILADKTVISTPTLVDTGVFRVNRAAISGAAPLLVSCGRLNLVKGWNLILESFVLVKKEIPAARLCFVGDGEDRAKLEAAIAAADLTDSVSITGFLPPAEVARMLNSADLFLLGSHREGWPTALVEAEACGLPAVATHVSGVSSLIEEGTNGYIVRSRDPAEFARAIVAALKLDVPNPKSLEIGAQHSLRRWRRNFGELWEPLR
ncbi:MAG: glycosyltransferase [Steroidobacteraceae bacterium]